MKIEEFAMQNNIPLDTVRYYVELGLIIPEKRDDQYDFHEGCQADLDNIIGFKEVGFRLNEIRSVSIFMRLGKLTRCQENAYFMDFFKSKKSELLNKIKNLKDFSEKLDGKIDELSKLEGKDNFQIGIDINVLRLLKCLKCGKDLMLTDGAITNNQVIDGKLKCTCGEEYKIEDGILLVGNEVTGNNEGLTKGKEILFEYMNSIDLEYLDNICLGLEYISKKINLKEFSNKIILELSSGGGFFLRNIYADLPEDSLYLAVDYDLGRQRFLKSILQKSEVHKKIIFICCDFTKIPLIDNSVDVLIDFSGTSNYSSEHREFLLDLTNKYVKNTSILIAAFVTFNDFSFNTSVDENLRRKFILYSIKNSISKLNYKMIGEKTSKAEAKGGKREEYYKDDGRVTSYVYYGKR